MINKKIIRSNSAPKAIGAYSPAVSTDKLLFTSGQIAIDSVTGQLISDDFEEQVFQVFKNLENILISENLSLDNILKLNVYMINLNNFNKLNDIFYKIFKQSFPSRSVVEVSRLPKNSKIEIDAICCR